MEQFNLEEWLKNKSRKVVTRRGNPVRIICTDRKHGEDELPVVFLEECNGGEFLLTCKSNGRNGSSKDYDTPYDLFFADEEEELSDFESKLYSTFSDIWQDYMLGREIDVAKVVKEYSPELLDLARNELIEELSDNNFVIDFAISKGKQDVLETLPKWKKAKKNEELDCHVAIQQDGRVVLSDFVQKDEYYITLDVLKKLPKEE